MSFEPTLISVVVPAFQAEATLATTLESVQRQTHQALEVVVVDDGSTDGTARIVRQFAAADSRFRLLTQPNAGVASARNVGFAASRGAYLAPIDADDLWHPRKLELQLAAIQAAGPTVGFVYTYYRRIDAEGRVLFDGRTSEVRGRVFLRHLLGNIVSNGSALLVRREAWESAGGYSPALQARQAQGCEDFLFQLLVARNWEVEVVPAFLTGYRRTPQAMSASRERMRRSRLAMYDIVEERFPETPPSILAVAQFPMRLGQATFAAVRLRPRDAIGELRQCVRLVARCSARDRLWLIRHGFGQIVRTVVPKLELIGYRALGRAGIASRAPFDSCDPWARVTPKAGYRTLRWSVRPPAVDDAALRIASHPRSPGGQ